MSQAAGVPVFEDSMTPVRQLDRSIDQKVLGREGVEPIKGMERFVFEGSQGLLCWNFEPPDFVDPGTANHPQPSLAAASVTV